MDTSETYTRMCQRAEHAAPELFYKPSYDVHDYTFKVEGNDLLWWLPRQDQLQEMVRNELLTIYGNLSRFWDWCNIKHEIGGECCSGTMMNWEYFTSMEQLWLAFLMKERYEKVWDSGKEEWIKHSH